jgi:hypothetical protein
MSKSEEKIGVVSYSPMSVSSFLFSSYSCQPSNFHKTFSWPISSEPYSLPIPNTEAMSQGADGVYGNPVLNETFHRVAADIDTSLSLDLQFLSMIERKVVSKPPHPASAAKNE